MFKIINRGLYSHSQPDTKMHPREVSMNSMACLWICVAQARQESFHCPIPLSQCPEVTRGYKLPSTYGSLKVHGAKRLQMHEGSHPREHS